MEIESVKRRLVKRNTVTTKMNDIFISYAREDKVFVSELAAALLRQGWTVWWDTSIHTGERFSQTIEEALNNSHSVIVVWSKYSVESDWVIAEANEARQRNTLIPIVIDDSLPPLIFRQLQTANLSSWNGKDSSAVFQQLVADIGNFLGGPSSDRQDQANIEFAADLARKSVEIRKQVLERKPDDVRTYWWYLMQDKKRATLLELSILLAVESLRISLSAEAEKSLRDGLVLLTRPIAELDYVGYRSSTLDFSPDGGYLATTSKKDTARIWDVQNWQEVKRFRHKGGVRALQFSPDGKTLATGDEHGTASLWDVTTGKEIFNMAHKGAVWDVAFSHDGTLLGTASLDRCARLWNVADGAEVVQFVHPVERVARIVFSPINRTLFTLSEDSIVRLWNLENGKALANFEHKAISEIAISPNGKYLATASSYYDDASVRLWDTMTMNEIIYMEHDGGVESVTFSPDGNYLASASYDKTARIWEIPGGEEVARLPHMSRVITVTFSHDGAYIATGSQGDGTRVWKVSNGEEVARLNIPGNVTAVIFSPDDEYVVAGSDSRDAMVWRLPIGDLVEEACMRLTRNLTSDEWHQYFDKQPYRKTCPEVQP